MATGRKYPEGTRPGARGGIEIRWEFKGKPYSEYIDLTPTPAHIKEASALRTKRIKEMRYAHEFGLPAADPRKAQCLTFADVADQLLDVLKKNDTVTFSTWQSYRSILKAHWLPVLRNVPIGAIDYPLLSEVFAKTNGLSKKTRKNILVPISKVFEYAQVELQCISIDPSSNLKVKQGQKPPIDPFTLEEQEAIIAAMPARSKLFYLIAFDTGMRSPSEILALKWFDFDGNSLSVTKGRVICRETTSTKTNKARTVQLTKRAIASLTTEKLKSTSEWIFANANGTPMLKDAQQKNDWNETLKYLGIRYRRPYTCRHTRASLGLKANVPPRWLAQQLGHSITVFETTYAKWINEESDKKYVAMMEDYTQERSQNFSKKIQKRAEKNSGVIELAQRLGEKLGENTV
jgi:integrase